MGKTFPIFYLNIMLQGNIFKIREGKLDQWKNWCHKINTELRNEAIETLKEEKVIQEAFVLLNIDGSSYAIGMGEGECLPATSRSINMEHKKQARECLEKIGKIDCLYHLKAPLSSN